MDRRAFIKAVVGAGGLFAIAELIEVLRLGAPEEEGSLLPVDTSSPIPVPSLTPAQTASPEVPAREETTMARIALVKTANREAGVKQAIGLFGNVPVSGKAVAVKPNFNSADPAPGSTHNDTLRALLAELKRLGAARIAVADRSGMGDTRKVMERKGIFEMGKSLGFDVVVLDELSRDDWVLFKPQDSHWRNGFYAARLFAQAESVVQTCNLKTHRFGGHFTMSLKNTVGVAARTVPGVNWDFMRELHSSEYQRLMIAELNVAYRPDLIVMDAVEAFADGGPDVGRLVRPEVVLAGTDRVAMDAVGVAILRMFGTTPEVSRGPIFKQEQIARAVELKLGVDSTEKIELVAADEESRSFAARIKEVLDRG